MATDVISSEAQQRVRIPVVFIKKEKKRVGDKVIDVRLTIIKNFMVTKNNIS